MNLFEEVAKLRAARRLWARIVKERFKAKNPDSMKLRLFSGCAASGYTSKEPLNNIVRGTIMTLVAVLAGGQAIHTTSYDEAYTIPSEEAQRTALRTQQIIAYETDVAAVADPMGGSYFLEYLTDRIEKEVEEVMSQIEQRGGMVKGIENGSIQKDITRSAYELERKIQDGEKVVVGVNRFVSDKKGPPIAIYRPGRSVFERQLSRLKEVKGRRNQRQVDLALQEIRRVAAGKGNLMGAILSAVCEYATVGEICQVLKNVFGEYKEVV